MWSARGAYRNEDGCVVKMPERSPMWIDKAGLLKQLEHDHPGIKLVGVAATLLGDWYSWVDDAGTERFAIIEEHE